MSDENPRTRGAPDVAPDSMLARVRARKRRAPVAVAPVGGGGGRGKVMAALVFVVVLAAVGWYITGGASETSKVQDCVMSGRKNCAPIDVGTNTR